MFQEFLVVYGLLFNNLCHDLIPLSQIQALWSLKPALLFIKSIDFYWVWRASNNQIRYFITWFCCILLLLSLLKPSDGYIDFCIYLRPSQHIISSGFISVQRSFKLLYRIFSLNSSVTENLTKYQDFIKNFPCPPHGLQCIEHLLMRQGGFLSSKTLWNWAPMLCHLCT